MNHIILFSLMALATGCVSNTDFDAPDTCTRSSKASSVTNDATRTVASGDAASQEFSTYGEMTIKQVMVKYSGLTNVVLSIRPKVVEDQPDSAPALWSVNFGPYPQFEPTARWVDVSPNLTLSSGSYYLIVETQSSDIEVDFGDSPFTSFGKGIYAERTGTAWRYYYGIGEEMGIGLNYTAPCGSF